MQVAAGAAAAPRPAPAAARHLPCRECGKPFSSKQARDAHAAAKHPKEPDHDGGSEGLPSSPPFDSMKGEWVHAVDFRGQKSFGMFKCPRHGRWMSAHAQRKDPKSFFRQGCKICKTKVEPYAMWVNDTYASSDSDTESDDSSSSGESPDLTKPHMAHLCEACRVGRCRTDGGENWALPARFVRFG